VSAADFQYGVTYSGLASLFGANLSDGVYSATTLPLPTKLGPTQVFLCYPPKNALMPSQIPGMLTTLGCVPTALVYVSPTQINFQVLPTAPPVPATATGSPVGTMYAVVSVANTVNANFTPGQLLTPQSPQPRIFSEGTDCLIDPRYQNRSTICGLTFTLPTGNCPGTTAPCLRADRGAVTDLNGNVLSSSNPAKLGNYYTIWLTGLGTFQNSKPPSPIDMLITNVPVYSFAGDTYLDYGPPDYVGSSSVYPGLYQINFKLPTALAGGGFGGYPPLFPCGTYSWEVSLDLFEGTGSSGKEANLIQIPIVVKPGDYNCGT
jgi:hypothetical protein